MLEVAINQMLKMIAVDVQIGKKKVLMFHLSQLLKNAKIQIKIGMKELNHHYYG
jgi:hypothetical protein